MIKPTHGPTPPPPPSQLFTYVRMGGGADRIVLKKIEGEAGEAALVAFDASKANCFLRRDREKLLAVVEASFGDLEPFNKSVRDLLGITLSDRESAKGSKRQLNLVSVRNSAKDVFNESKV